MARTMLPNEGDRIYYTDGGLETVLIFIDGIDLPGFASFPLLDSAEGRESLRAYYQRRGNGSTRTPSSSCTRSALHPGSRTSS
jgi:hypothetical protein